MPEFGLTDEGFNAPRANDFLIRINDLYAAETGLTVGQIESDKTLSRIFTIMADELDTQSEASIAIYDSRRRNNATGLQLDDLGGIIGVSRNDATFSQVALDVDGDTGTVIPSGSLVEGGGPDGISRWELIDNITLTAGADTGVFRAVDSGPITAEIGDIDKIVTPVNGWTTVINAGAVTLEEAGEARETDQGYRLRQQQSFQAVGGRSLNALRGQLQSLRDTTGVLFVQAAVVVDNDTSAAVVKEGLSLDAHSLAVVIHPSTLTTAQKQQILDQIYKQTPAGIKTMGTDVVGTVFGADGIAKSINFDFATTFNVDVTTSVKLDTGFVLSDVESTIQELVTVYFDDLNVGDPARTLDLLALTATVPGVIGAGVLLNGGLADIEEDLTALLTLGLNTVSISI